MTATNLTRIPGSVIERFRGMSVARVERSLRLRSLRLLGRFDSVREITALASGFGPPSTSAESNIFLGVNPEAVVGSLEREGVHRGLVLPDPMVSEIKAFADDNPCFGNLNPKWGFRYHDKRRAEERVRRRFTVAHYFNTSASCGAIRALENDPLLQQVARRYVGSRAKHVGTHLWWSFAGDVTPEDQNEFAQLFHFDLDDFRFLKVFFYLTDVDAESGPHVYVRGTHRGKRLRHVIPMRRLADEDVAKTYGADRVITIEGKAGTGFIEDTFGLHKGTPPLTKDRLVLQIEFANRYYGFGNDIVDPQTLSLL